MNIELGKNRSLLQQAGRAFGALVDLIRKEVFKRGETVLFWDTGSARVLFAYAQAGATLHSSSEFTPLRR